MTDMTIRLSILNRIGLEGEEQKQFSYPYFATIIDTESQRDDEQLIYVTDYENHRIQIFKIDGEFIESFGTKGNGESQFENPSGIAFDGEKLLFYVCDTFNHRVQIYDENMQYLKSIGSYGTEANKLNEPAGVAVDLNGNIYVVERGNHRVQIFSSEGDSIRIIGAGNEGKKEEDTFESAPGMFNHPWGIALFIDENNNDNNKIFVTDEENHRVQAFSFSGEFLFQFGSLGKEQGQFNHPTGIAVTEKGQVIVCDNWNDRLQVFDVKDGSFINEIGRRDSVKGFIDPNGITISCDGRTILVTEAGELHDFVLLKIL
jgi:tripartite motif-containing protein 71